MGSNIIYLCLDMLHLVGTIKKVSPVSVKYLTSHGAKLAKLSRYIKIRINTQVIYMVATWLHVTCGWWILAHSLVSVAYQAASCLTIG